MSPQEINRRIQQIIDDFNEGIPALQNEAFKRTISVLKELDLRSGTIKPTIQNLRKLKGLKSDLFDSIFTENYQKNVNNYIHSFQEVQNLQTKYFSSAFKEFAMNGFIDELRKQTIEDVAIQLTKAGLEANVIEPARKIIMRNLTEGANFGDLVSEMREFMTTTEGGGGALSRYAQTYTNDSLSIFAAEYNKSVTDDLGLTWFEYTGAIVGGSRDFCKRLVQKQFIHLSEISDIVSKDWAGKKDNTTKGNFQSNRGGWNCNHQLMPIAEERVPEDLIVKFK